MHARQSGGDADDFNTWRAHMLMNRAQRTGDFFKSHTSAKPYVLQDDSS